MNYRGQVLCEDCYVDAVSLPKTCDAAAVRSTKLTKKLAGQEGITCKAENNMDLRIQ